MVKSITVFINAVPKCLGNFSNLITTILQYEELVEAFLLAKLNALPLPRVANGFNVLHSTN